MKGLLRSVLFLTSIVCCFGVAAPVHAAGDEKIIFLHHSTGWGVYSGGDVPGWFAAYNSAHGTSYGMNERSYPDSPYPWANYPYDYWNLWLHGVCSSDNVNIECLNTLTQKFDVIIFKHCFPGADVLADTGSPDVGSDRKSLENYKLQYRALRDLMDQYPQTIFIVWTLAPLHRNATTAANAGRAKQFVDWVKNDFLTEDAKRHGNIFIFDFWGLAAGNDNFLKYAYEGSHTGTDSHPNQLANQTIGPLFSQAVVDAIKSFNASIDTTPPAVPTGLTLH